MNGDVDIPAVIRTDMGDETDARFFNLSENLQRKDLDIVQEARALAKLERLGVSEDDAAKRLNMSRGWVQIRYMVLRLPLVVQAEIAAGWLKQTQIRKIYTAFMTGGEFCCFEKVKELKDDTIKGRSPERKKRKQPKAMVQALNSKKLRERDDIFALQDYLYEELKGNSIATRLLAWCAGEITSLDMHNDLKAWAESQGKSYRMPE